MNRYLYTILLIAFSVSETKAQMMNTAPKLVVNITIDQLRSDYIEAFSALYTNDGFKKLFTDGKVFENASYSFVNIDRASAIATLSTGSNPYYHGIVGQQWMNKNTLQPVSCTDDSKNGASPANIQVSTLGDEIKVSTEGKAVVFSIAKDCDASILTAGHAADGALWLNGNLWTTSTYFSKNIPNWVKTQNEINITNSVQFKDNQSTNTAITDMALQCIRCNAMGTDNATDLLNITYSAENEAKEKITQWQSNLQKTYVSLDRTLAQLIGSIEKMLGKQNVLFVLTSTGYSKDEDITLYSKYKVPTGIFYINRTSNLLNMYLGAIYGQGRYVETCFHNQIFLNQKLIEQKRMNMVDVLKRSQAFLMQISGVRDVYTSDMLLTTRSNDLEKVRNGYDANKNGDIIVEIAPGWQLKNENNLENYTQRATFVPFPIIFYGNNAKAQRIVTPAKVERIAPTIAKCIRIRAPNACFEAPLF